MKNNLLYLLLFYSTLINGQSIKLGFDLQAHQIRYNGNQILGDEYVPLSYHLNMVYNPLKKISFQAKIGRTLSYEFAGWEFGIACKYRFHEPIYFSAGILHHSNEGGGGSNSRGRDYASILMLHSGLGIDIASFMAIEFGYYHPTSKEVIGWSRAYTEVGSSHIFERMFRLGFIFAWEL